MKLNKQIFIPIFLIVVCIALVPYFIKSGKPTIATPSVESSQPDTVVASKTPSYPTDQPGSLWWIVNKNHPAGKDYVPTGLVKPNVPLNLNVSSQEQMLLPDVAKQVELMFSGASDAGNKLMLASGYRSYALQASIFNSYSNQYGVEKANTFSAKPGYSEHQTGMALDISTTDRYHYLDVAFGDDPAGKWLANNSYKYGFILRYPLGKDAITGYQYEPWHFRYVGVDLATILFNNQQTMEEYFKSN